MKTCKNVVQVGKAAGNTGYGALFLFHLNDVREGLV